MKNLNTTTGVGKLVKNKLFVMAIFSLGLLAAGCSFPDINFGGTTNTQAVQDAGGGTAAE